MMMISNKILKKDDFFCMMMIDSILAYNILKL